MFKQKKRKVKQLPDPPKLCQVVNKNGFPYDLVFPSEDATKEVLMIQSDTGDSFPAHARAHSAIHHTIEWLKSQNKPWSKDDFRVVDL